jgi:hypothetical protein
MAREVVIGGETFKRRNPLAVWLLLPFITLGIYFFVYWYKINNEARRYLRDPSIQPGTSLLAVLLGWILIVPPFVTVFTTAGRVRRMQENARIPDRIDPWIALLLRFFFGLDILYLQVNLNKIWDAYGMSYPGAPYTAMPPPYPAPPGYGPPQYPGGVAVPPGYGPPQYPGGPPVPPGYGPPQYPGGAPVPPGYGPPPPPPPQ